MKWLFLGRIVHRRTRPVVNTFKYSVFYLNFPLSAIEKIRRFIFSINKFNLFSFYIKDHCKGEENDLLVWGKKEFQKNQLDVAEINLQTFPRFLGFIFNPVSFWYGYSKNQELVGIIAEVNNTFGDSINYVIHRNGEVISSGDKFILKKKMHVSPFNDVEGKYEFSFYMEGRDVVKSVIRYFVEDELLLYTHIEGKSQELSSLNLIVDSFKVPLITFKILFLIHYQALKIYLKGVPFVGAIPKKKFTED